MANTYIRERNIFTRQLTSEIKDHFPLFDVVFHRKSADGDFCTAIAVSRLQEDTVLESLILALPEIIPPNIMNHPDVDSRIFLQKITARADFLRSSIEEVAQRFIATRATYKEWNPNASGTPLLSDESLAVLNPMVAARAYVEDHQEQIPELPGRFGSLPSHIIVRGAIFCEFAKKGASKDEDKEICAAYARKAAANYQEFARNRSLPLLPERRQLPPPSTSENSNTGPAA